MTKKHSIHQDHLEEENTNNNGYKPQHKKQKAIGILINFLLVVIIGIAILLVWDRIQSPVGASKSSAAQEPDIVEQVTATEVYGIGGATHVDLSPYATAKPFEGDAAVSRNLDIHTTIPTRPRVDVITYTVETGDTLFSIAELYGLKPETILWGNYDVLQDNPHLLKPAQVLNILPVDGTYYEWAEGDSLDQVADFFDVEVQDIVEYAGNRFDLTVTSLADPGLDPGDGLIIPGGEREVQDWGPPQISRDNPASAANYGPGSCGEVYTGAIGYGTFIWPTDYHYITQGYNSSIHPAIDIGGSTGDPIYATDAGVVVYAGWSNWGYGNLIVLDHGNGWQSAYAHLSSLSVGCGQSVFQGTVIGGLGSTGNSTGPHLHFELVYLGSKPNPLNFVQ